jgi:phosphoribosylanthranilate isomerase
MIAIKFCGLTRVDDALAAAGLGASALGLVLWPGSPRHVSEARAVEIVQALPPFVTPVAVLVSPTVTEVRQVIDRLGVRAVQVHGPVHLDTLLDGPWQVIRAMSADEACDPPGGAARLTCLIDTVDPARHGGTGQTADWSLAARAASLRRVVLAGGLTPANVREAVRQVRPYGVDVATGIETAPGVKDVHKMHQFVAAVRAADRQGQAAAS